MFRTVLLTLLAATALSSPVFAADAVTVRSGTDKGFTRIVFQWPAGVPYHVTKEAPGKLKVAFDRPATLDTGGLETGGGSNIASLRQLSSGDAPLALEVGIPEGSTFRDFGIGGKIILDVYDPPGKKTGKAAPRSPVKAPETKAPEVKTPEPKTPEPKTPEPKKAEIKTPEPVRQQDVKKTETPAPAVAAAAKKLDLVPEFQNARTRAAAERLKITTGAKAETPQVETPQTEPAHAVAEPAAADAKADPKADVITLTTTETVGMAAFLRDGSLWLVADRSNMAVPPKITGPDKDRLGGLQKMDVAGASAWTLKLPDDMRDFNVYGEGGGLVWKIALTPGERYRHETAVLRPDADEKEKGHNQDGVLVWPLRGVTRVIDVPDAREGDRLQVVTVAQADQYAGAPYQYVDFETLPSPVGLAVLPHFNDLAVKKTKQGVEVSRPAGLRLSSAEDITRSKMQKEGQGGKTSVVGDGIPGAAPIAPPAGGTGKDGTVEKFFDLNRWMMGGTDALGTNQTLLLSNLKAKDTNARVQDLLTLAKMNLANDRGPEALGFLTFASEELPVIADSPEFIAMRGAAEAVSGEYELGLADLSIPALAPYKELDYWRAYTLASLEDWKQAADVMPNDVSVLMGYPQPLLEKMGPKLTEVALRGGDLVKANLLLAALKKSGAALHPWTAAAVDYLQGQADVQKNNAEAAEKLWRPLLKGEDDFFRVRAGLALTMLELKDNKIKLKDAIDRLEGMRYGWRGDELETQINLLLGKLYIQDKQYLKGFTILRDAAGMSPDADINKEVTGYMASSFKDILMNATDISPVDAMNIYQQFHELAPPGDEGNKLVQKLADRLASTDLLGRAGDLLQSQVDYSLQGREKADVAMRLAAIGLLNKDPQRTFGALDKAVEFYNTLPAGPEKDKALHATMLMRARAVAQQGKTEEALGMLAKMGAAPDVSSLRADIAWQAAMWPDAADALRDLITDENLEANKTFTEHQANLILNRAVALNLGGDRVELASMRQKYIDRMKPTTRGSMFEVVTRPHSINVMSEQQTLQGMVGEVDMFRDFLNDYKSVTDKGNLTTTGAPAPAEKK